MSLCKGAGKLHPALLENRVIGVIPAVLGVQLAAAALEGAKLHGADGIIQRAEGLAARPVIVFFGGIVKALPCAEVAVFRARIGGEAGKAAAVAHDKVR